MSRKDAISVTLSVDNLLWLRARATASGGGSVSAELDRLVARARTAAGGAEGSRSVVGTVRISADDPALEQSDALLRALFARHRGEGLVAEAAAQRPASSGPIKQRRRRSG